MEAAGTMESVALGDPKEEVHIILHLYMQEPVQQAPPEDPETQ